MAKFSSGKHALGICDRCGLSYKLHELKTERVKRMVTNLLVCSDCWDEDHPQNFIGEVHPVDAEALRNPRPDTDPGREITGTVVYPPINGVVE
jgi:hypothetical protein